MRTITVLFILALSTIAYAQTPTNTPHPSALTVSVHQFEDLSSPEIELTGTWSVNVVGSTETLLSSVSGSSMTFNVNVNADYLLIYRQTYTADPGQWTACIDALPCLTVSDAGNDSIQPVAIKLSDTYSEIVVTKTDNNESQFDFMTIALGEAAIQATPHIIVIPLIATPVSGTPTPDYTSYVEATDEAGDTYYVRRDSSYSMTDEIYIPLYVSGLIVGLSILVVLLWKK